jgi:hypothetical protein
MVIKPALYNILSSHIDKLFNFLTGFQQTNKLRMTEINGNIVDNNYFFRRVILKIIFLIKQTNKFLYNLSATEKNSQYNTVKMLVKPIDNLIRLTSFIK